MAKVKIKCASCGKSFKSPDPKKTLCPDCQAARKAMSGAKMTTPVAAPPPVGPSIDLRAAFRAAQEAGGSYAAYRPAPPPPEPVPAPPVVPAAGLPAAPPLFRDARPAEPRPPRPPRAIKAPRPVPAPRPPKELQPPTPPFQPTAEQVEAIRTRYLELAQPEFNGIRHQIAAELAVPIRAVKAMVKELRVEMSMPSWWELAMASLTDEQREAVRAHYLPHLPLPPIGIHKILADQLGLKQLAVYSAIRSIRDELNLPRFNERGDWTGQRAAGQNGDGLPAPEQGGAQGGQSHGAAPVPDQITVGSAGQYH